MATSCQVALVNCDQGRQMGCATFCCRLLVRLKPHEMQAGENGAPAKGFVGKTADGLCIHLDRESWRCGIWDKRPEICREYDCNSDPLLQIALRGPFKNIVELSIKAARGGVEGLDFIGVPHVPAEA